MSPLQGRFNLMFPVRTSHDSLVCPYIKSLRFFQRTQVDLEFIKEFFVCVAIARVCHQLSHMTEAAR